jgi:hypothetical protein
MHSNVTFLSWSIAPLLATAHLEAPIALGPPRLTTPLLAETLDPPLVSRPRYNGPA